MASILLYRPSGNQTDQYGNDGQYQEDVDETTHCLCKSEESYQPAYYKDDCDNG